MNRIAGRSRFVLILAAVLVLGLVIFSGEYLFQAKEWVVFPGSPHVYRGSNLNCGVVTDRTGAVLLDATDGRTYSDDRTVRLATLHLLGDREGYISAPAVSEYSSQMVGFDLINGVAQENGRTGAEPCAQHQKYRAGHVAPAVFLQKILQHKASIRVSRETLDCEK